MAPIIVPLLCCTLLWSVFNWNAQAQLLPVARIPDFATPECRKFIDQFHTQYPDFQWEWVSVPLDDQGHQQTSVFVYGELNKARQGAMPLAIFIGGAFSHYWKAHQAIYAPIRKQFPATEKLAFIYTDFRGRGCSEPFQNNLKQLQGTLRHYKKLKLLSGYYVAKDLIEIRKKLIGPKRSWKVLGQSSGSIPAQYLTMLDAQHLSSVHINGYSLTPSKSDYRYLYRLHVARNLTAFFEARPALLEKINSTREQLITASQQTCKPVAQEDCKPILSKNLNEEWQWLFWMTTEDGREQLQSSLNTRLEEFSRVDSAVAPRYWRPKLEVATEATVKNAVYHLISFLDYAGKAETPQDAFNCQIAHQRIQKEYPELRTFWELEYLTCPPLELNPTLLALNQHAIKDRQYLRLTLAKVKKALKKRQRQGHSLPFYLYSNTSDVFAPPTYFEAAEAYLRPFATVRYIPGNHDGFYVSEQFWNEISN